MKKLLIISLLFIIAKANVNAQISFKAEYMGTSAYRDGKTDKKIENYKGSAVVYQTNVGIPLSVKLNEREQPTMWALNLGTAYASLSNKNFRENLVDDEIFDLFLGVSHTRPLNKKWMMAVSVGAGIYSPTKSLSKITRKQILGNMAVVFIYNVRPNLQLGGGLAINNAFGYPMAFPALYLNWFAGNNWKANINMTEGLNASFGYWFTDYFSLNLALEMNGQMSFIKKDGKDMMFSHMYIVAGLRPEFKIAKKLNIPITIGVSAVRSAGYEKRTLKAMFSDTGIGYFQVSPYVSAGLSIDF